MYCYNNFFPHSKSLLTPWIGARLSVIQKSPMMINAKRHLADVAVSLENKCDNLEARSRRKNIRIMRVPGTRLLCIPFRHCWRKHWAWKERRCWTGHTDHFYRLPNRGLHHGSSLPISTTCKNVQISCRLLGKNNRSLWMACLFPFSRTIPHSWLFSSCFSIPSTVLCNSFRQVL